MSDREAKIRQELEEEAQTWIKEEFARRYQTVRDSIEKQGMETVEHLKSLEASQMEISQHMAHMQTSMAYAKGEIMNDIKFEAENWVEEELKKRLAKD